MIDYRNNFEGATEAFREFLRSQGWSDSLLWLTKDRITGFRNRYWILRPDELTSDASSRQFYEVARQGSSSIRIDGFTQMNGKTLSYVEDWGGDSRLLNFGTLESKIEVSVVHSELLWSLLVLINRIRGESPFLKETRITPSAQPGRYT